MNFAFDEQQRELGETVAAALADIGVLMSPDLEPQGHAEAWDTVSGLGLFALLVPEDQGGVGLTICDLALSIEAIGAGLAPPIISSTLIAAELIQRVGSNDQDDASRCAWPALRGGVDESRGDARGGTNSGKGRQRF